MIPFFESNVVYSKWTLSRDAVAEIPRSRRGRIKQESIEGYVYVCKPSFLCKAFLGVHILIWKRSYRDSFFKLFLLSILLSNLLTLWLSHWLLNVWKYGQASLVFTCYIHHYLLNSAFAYNSRLTNFESWHSSSISRRLGIYMLGKFYDKEEIELRCALGFLI